MAGLTLQDLIEAMSTAVIQAQDRVEKAQIRNIRQFFDSNNRPERVLLRVPSIRPTAEEGDEDFISVPLITLISHSQLAIANFKITMEVELGELASPDTRVQGSEPKPGEAAAATASSAPTWEAPEVRKELSVDLAAPRARRRGPTATVTLRVKSREPTEGMARMLAELTKRIGVNEK